MSGLLVTKFCGCQVLYYWYFCSCFIACSLNFDKRTLGSDTKTNDFLWRSGFLDILYFWTYCIVLYQFCYVKFNLLLLALNNEVKLISRSPHIQNTKYAYTVFKNKKSWTRIDPFSTTKIPSLTSIAFKSTSNDRNFADLYIELHPTLKHTLFSSFKIKQTSP